MNNTLYIKSTDELRPFLELAGYGCYSRQQMKQLLDKSGTYDKRIEFLNVCLPPDCWNYHRQGKERRFSFQGDAYHSLSNGLVPIFSMKSLDLQWLICYLAILAALKSSGNGGMPYKALEEATTQLLYDLLLPRLKDIPFKNQPDWKQQLEAQPYRHQVSLQLGLQIYHENWNSQIRRRLTDLINAGFVCTRQPNRDILYTLAATRPSLAQREKSQLYHTIPLLAAAALFSLPGWYLASRQPSMTKQPSYQIRYANPLQICNDSQLYLLLTAIHSNCCISFVYRGRQKSGFPLSVYTDSYQREYVTLHTNNHTTIYRIHRMNHIRLLRQKRQTAATISSSYQHIELKLHFHSRQKFHHLTGIIWHHVPHAVITNVSEGTAQCLIKSRNNRSLIPWLRTLHPDIEIIDDSSHNLRNRIAQDIKEALLNYDITL